MNPDQALAEELAGDAIVAALTRPGQLVVSRQVGPVWPNGGNSFWLTRVDDRWCLFTWAPAGYRVPTDADAAELCRRCMSQGDAAMTRVPADVVEAFDLQELSQDEIRAIRDRMPRRDPPHE